MEIALKAMGSFILSRFLVSEKMTEELDLMAQDSDAGSEEVVLTPAELIERLEQVRVPSRIASVLAFLFSPSGQMSGIRK